MMFLLPVVVLASLCPRVVGGDQDPVLVPEASTELEQLRAERSAWLEREALLIERIDSLERELTQHERWREERTREWLAFTRLISELDLPAEVSLPSYAQSLVFATEEAVPTDPVESHEELAARGRRERSEAMRRDLRVLLTAEHVFDLDVLEVGTVRDGATGPVVLRLLDDYGRPIGNLAADRMRLEASRAGRIVTLVLEDGRELVHGQRTGFDGARDQRGGVRRIDLVDVDPEPWIDALPELFDTATLETILDDGSYDLDQVRHRLNGLLKRHSAGGDWRLQGMIGVVDDVLLDVQVLQLRPDGRIERRLFADRLELELRGTALWMTLRDGVQERSGRTTPFLDGRYRIVLPGIDPEVWRTSGLPGLALE